MKRITTDGGWAEYMVAYVVRFQIYLRVNLVYLIRLW